MIGYPPTRANSKNRYFLDSLLKLAFCHWIWRSQKILGRVPEKKSGRCGWVYHDVFDVPMPKNRCAKRFWPNGPSTAEQSPWCMSLIPSLNGNILWKNDRMTKTPRKWTFQDKIWFLLKFQLLTPSSSRDTIFSLRLFFGKKSLARGGNDLAL